MLNDFKYWVELTGREVEKFTGDTVLISEESLKKSEVNIATWKDLINKILTRHGGYSNPNHEALFKEIQIAHTQFRIRSQGDNGLARALLNFNAILEAWYQKLFAHVQSANSEVLGKKMGSKMIEPEWVVFYESFAELNESINLAIKCIGVHYLESEDKSGDIQKSHAPM